MLSHRDCEEAGFHASGRISELGFSFQSHIYGGFYNADYFIRFCSDIPAASGQVSAWNKKHGINPLFSKGSMNAFVDIIINNINDMKTTFLFLFKMLEWKWWLIFYFIKVCVVSIRITIVDIELCIMSSSNIIPWSACVQSCQGIITSVWITFTAW